MMREMLGQKVDVVGVDAIGRGQALVGNGHFEGALIGIRHKATRALLLSCAAALIAGSGSARAAEPPAAFRAKVQEVVEKDGARGVTAIVMKDGRRLYRLDLGEIAPDAQLPIASASKWLAGALIMTVVDEGKLSLDEPIGRRLPQFRGEAGKITLRQLISFTSGMGSGAEQFERKLDPRISLGEAATLIAARPLVNPPGTVWEYGGPSLQVAGALVEQATGRRWADLFAERISGPLGMSKTYWGGDPTRFDVPPDQVRNPLLQGGAVTTAEDYARFLTMLQSGGTYAGHRILSAESLREMESDQNRAVTIKNDSDIIRDWHYGLANWCETPTPDHGCNMVSSGGAWGVFPWIDRTTGVYGVFFMKHDIAKVLADLIVARRLAIEGAR